MVGRTAGHHLDPADFPDVLIRKTKLLDDNFSILDPRMNRICHGFRLLVDLLQHKMLKTAFFRGFRIPLHGPELFFQDLLVHVVESDGIFG